MQPPSPVTAVVFFVQGLAFFMLGISILVATRPKTSLALGRWLGLLAAFGFLHSLSAWVEFVRRLPPASEPVSGVFELVRNALLVLYSIALAEFGANVLRSLLPKRPALAYLPLALAVWWLPPALVVGYLCSQGAIGLAVVEAIARYLIYLPAALLSALALFWQGRVLVAARLPSLEADCRNAALAFAAYAVSGGVIVPTGILLSSPEVPGQNYGGFLQLPIEILRLVLAPAVAILIVRVLRVFEFERYLEIENLNGRLRELSHALVAAQENERRRIARELHDEASQLLSTLLLRLRLIENVQTPAELHQRCGEVIQLAAEAAESIRRMAHQLRPIALDDLGLVAAVQWYVAEYSAREGIQVSFKTQGFVPRFAPEVELAVYRAIQECLTNVAKHARTREASVCVEGNNGILTVTVEDQGCGFDVSAVQNGGTKTLGLLGMRERIELVGGTIEIKSATGRGTVVRFTVPTRSAPAAGENREGVKNGQDQSATVRRPSRLASRGG